MTGLRACSRPATTASVFTIPLPANHHPILVTRTVVSSIRINSPFGRRIHLRHEMDQMFLKTILFFHYSKMEITSALVSLISISLAVDVVRGSSAKLDEKPGRKAILGHTMYAVHFLERSSSETRHISPLFLIMFKRQGSVLLVVLCAPGCQARWRSVSPRVGRLNVAHRRNRQNI